MNKQMLIKLVLLAAILMSQPCKGVAQDPREEAIRQKVKEYESAWNRADANAAAAVYAEDGIHFYINGEKHQGRNQIEEGLQAFFSGPLKGSQIQLITDNIHFPADDIAVEEESFLLTGSDGMKLSGKCLAVYRLHQQQWLAYAIQCMLPMAEPQETGN